MCCAKMLQSCPTLFDFVDCSLPGSSVHGIFQARILEWVSVQRMFLTQGLNVPCGSHNIGEFFTGEPLGKPRCLIKSIHFQISRPSWLAPCQICDYLYLLNPEKLLEFKYLLSEVKARSIWDTLADNQEEEIAINWT